VGFYDVGMSDAMNGDARGGGEATAGGAAVAPAAVRLGAVSYLNTLPLIEGLGKLADVRLTLTAPSQLMGLLIGEEDGGEVDLALASTIDALRCPEPLELVPAGVIGCDGPTLTVRVFSRGPIEAIETLTADADSHTSVALASVVLHERTGRLPTIRSIDADALRAARERGDDDAWPDALLMIGDKVITHAPPATLYPHQLDLGEAWHGLTGLPFVYAAWTCRAGALDAGRLRAAAAVLDRQRRHNATRLDWIVAARATARGWPADVARHYLRDLLRYEPTERMRAGLAAFFERCVALGLHADASGRPGHEANRESRWAAV
jgi:chorismate dehydratase